MKENYDLEKVIDGCLKVQEEQASDQAAGSQETDTLGEEDLPDDSVDPGSSIMEEPDHRWKPMRRFLNRKKKQKWGDWDGLYIEEEELN